LFREAEDPRDFGRCSAHFTISLIVVPSRNTNITAQTKGSRREIYDNTTWWNIDQHAEKMRNRVKVTFSRQSLNSRITDILQTTLAYYRTHINSCWITPAYTGIPRCYNSRR